MSSPPSAAAACPGSHRQAGIGAVAEVTGEPYVGINLNFPHGIAFCRVRSAAAMLAPSRLKASVMAAPIQPAAPVTRTRFPSNFTAPLSIHRHALPTLPGPSASVMYLQHAYKPRFAGGQLAGGTKACDNFEVYPPGNMRFHDTPLMAGEDRSSLMGERSGRVRPPSGDQYRDSNRGTRMS